MDLVQQENKCFYCGCEGKHKRKFNMILCDRHYRQLLKYGEVIPTRYDNNNYFAILTTNKHNIMIDIEDIDRCKKYKWRICGNNGYAFTIDGNNKIYLHNYIMNSKSTIDHINHNIYDCRKENLREVSKSKNMMNSFISKRNTSGVKGVSFDKSRNKWIASIQKDGITYNVGRYSDFNEAVLSRFKKEIELFGVYSIYYNKNNGNYSLNYFYNNKQYFVNYNNGVIEVTTLDNEDRGGIGNTGIK